MSVFNPVQQSAPPASTRTSYMPYTPFLDTPTPPDASVRSSYTPFSPLQQPSAKPVKSIHLNPMPLAQKNSPSSYSRTTPKTDIRVPGVYVSREKSQTIAKNRQKQHNPIYRIGRFFSRLVEPLKTDVTDPGKEQFGSASAQKE